jgi:hypothetical protein
MTAEFPWLKMLMTVGILVGMFAGPLTAIKLHSLYTGRRARRAMTTAKVGDP